jgi:hypothetical protein
MRREALASVLIVALCVAGCSGSASKSRAVVSSGSVKGSGACPLTQAVADIVAPGLSPNGSSSTGCGYGGDSATVVLTVIPGSPYPGHTAEDLVASGYQTWSSKPGTVAYVPELGSGAYEHVDPDGAAATVDWVEDARAFLLVVATPGGSKRTVSAALAIY